MSDCRLWRHWRAIVALCCLLPLSAPAAPAAQALRPEDFASGLRLQTIGAEPFYRLDLPLEIYTSNASGTLQDIRVFNSAGEIVPHSVVPMPGPARNQTREMVLDVMRLPPQPEASAATGQLHIESGGIDLQWKQAAGAAPLQWLLTGKDGKDMQLNSLRLDWDDGETSWQQQVTIETSDDMKDWQLVAEGLPLFDLQENGKHLRENTLHFAETTARYWRLTLRGNAEPHLARVTGLLRTMVDNTPMVWLKPVGMSVDADGNRVFHFATPQNARHLRIEWPQRNSVVTWTGAVRTATDGRWVELGDQIGWNLLRDGQSQGSQPLELPGGYVSDVRIGSRTGWGKGEPQVELGQPALTLVFNARGPGPYLLAWGARAAPRADLPPERLIPGYATDTLDSLPAAIPGDSVTLGGPARLTEPGRAEQQARWKNWALWGALLAAAAMLSAMAWHMWRHIPFAAPASTADKDASSA